MDQFSQWAKHVRRASWPGGAVVLRWGLMVLLIGLVAALYLVQASQMSTIGRNLEEIRAQYDLLKRENAELLEQIAKDGSIPRLQQRSAEMGFIPAQQVRYVLVPAPVAAPSATHSSPWPACTCGGSLRPAQAGTGDRQGGLAGPGDRQAQMTSQAQP